MPEATVTIKGQVTIPRKIRRHLGVGEKLDLILGDDGEVTVRPVRRSVRDMAGMLHRPDMAAAPVEEMDAGIAEVVAGEDERIRRGGRVRGLDAP